MKRELRLPFFVCKKETVQHLWRSYYFSPAMYIKNKLESAKAYRLRKANDLDGCIDFASNDYLGCAKEGVPVPRENSADNIRSSRMLFGQHKALSDLEKAAALQFGFEKAIVFPSGYQANVGLISAFSGRRVNFYYDELIHASMHDGLRLGVNNKFSFVHNNADALAELLKKHAKSADINIVLCEGLYSMDGDVSNPKEIEQVAEKYGAKIIVDEAHSAGIYGENGLGLWTMNPAVLAKVVTFGKAYGAEGAVVLCSNETHEFLYQYCRSLIYSTAPSVHFCQSAWQALEWVSKAESERLQLQENIKLFRASLKNGGETLPSLETSPVQVLILPTDALLAIEKEAAQQKIALKAIFYPTVAKGQERLRISLHAFNTHDEILKLCVLLNQYL